MKRIVSVLIAVLMLSVSVFGAEYSITNKDFDRVEDEITIKYSGHTDEYMTIFVYDVTGITGESDTPPWDGVEKTPIIGLDQAVGSGEFNIKIKPEFSGDVVVVLGGEYGDSTKILLKIVNGIPEVITDVEYDAGGDTATVGEGKTITIQQGNKLLNATVSTTGTGKVEYINADNATVTLTGDISFDANGVIDAVSGKAVEIRSADGSGAYNVGYIHKLEVTPEHKTCTIVLSSDGKTATQSFELNNVLQGEVRIHSLINNVPEGVVITPEVTVE